GESLVEGVVGLVQLLGDELAADLLLVASNSPSVPSPVNRSPHWPTSSRSAASSSPSSCTRPTTPSTRLSPHPRTTRPTSSAGFPSPSPGSANWSAASP